jgi:alanine racemase
MTLKSKLIAIHDLHAGDSVGYSSTWICPENMRIGIVAIGYGDGYAYNTRSGAPLLVSGVSCPLIGRVAMDMINVDLRQHNHAKVGDEVVLWGRGLPIENVAQYAGTISFELFSRLTSRVSYFYNDYI